MTTATERAVLDPVGLVVDLVTQAVPELDAGTVVTVVEQVAAGRAKRRRLAAALLGQPAVLATGRSPAPRVIGELLTALRAAGAADIAAPRCAGCGKALRTFQRRGQDWWCTPCAGRPQPCAACGNLRLVACRDRHGQPRCGQCPDDDDGIDPLARIHQVVAAADPTLDPATVAAAVAATVTRPTHLRRLARALAEQPELLTGAGHLAPIPVVLRLIDALCAAGATGIVRPACARCHRVVRLDKPHAGQRVCRRCIAELRAQPCSRCGTVREPATRDAQGRPLCPSCLSADPVNQEECIRCGRRRPVSVRTGAGPVCPSCVQPPTLTCAICGLEAPCEISRATGQPWCRACQQRWMRCTGCGEVQPLRGGTLDRPLCSACTRPDPGFWRRCPTCGITDRLCDDQCVRCTLDQRLHQLLADADGTVRPGLRAVNDALRGTERPDSTLAWLARPSVRTLLAELASGARPLTHEALDALGSDKTARHLRAVLIAAGALPTRDEHLARLERWMEQAVSAIADPQDRHLIGRYAVWHHLRRLRRRAAPTGITYGQAVHLQRRTKAAIGFLELLAAHGLTLATCQQTHLDHWLAHDQVPRRDEVGTFVRWATANKLARLDFPATKWHGPTGPIDADRRWQVARRLLHDDALSAADRVAGLLVVLYAQNVSDIARLTVDEVTITGDRVDLRLGPVPIALPEPLSILAATLVTTRRGHAVSGDPATSIWLFPGGQPGRPISAYRLRERLGALGVNPGGLRTAALFQLATELPAAILARSLGIHVSVAVQWQRAASADWAGYAAELGRRRTSAEQAPPSEGAGEVASAVVPTPGKVQA